MAILYTIYPNTSFHFLLISCSILYIFLYFQTPSIHNRQTIRPFLGTYFFLSALSPSGKEKLFNEYKKYFEKLETQNYVAIAIADYKALLVAMKAEFQDKIAKRDAEAKALRKKYEEEIAFYEQIRQAKAKCHEVEAKEYNNEHPNFLCRAAISSAEKELSKL